MEVQEQVNSSQSKIILEELEASLAEAYQIENTIPDDMQTLLDRIGNVEFCREVTLDQADQRITRLLSNTANQSIAQ